MDPNASISVEDDTIIKNTEPMDLPLDRYKDMALRSRPEVIALEALVQQTFYDEKIIKGDKWPGLSVEAAIGKSGEAYVKEDLILATEWSVYAVMEWVFWGNSMAAKYGDKKTEPSAILDTSVRIKTTERFIQLSLLDRLDYYYQRQEKKISHAQANKELEDIRKKVQMEVEKSYASLKVAESLIVLSTNKLELYKKKVKIVEKKNFLGEATSKDLIEARMKVSLQKDSMAEALVKYNIAVAELKMSSD